MILRILVMLVMTTGTSHAFSIPHLKYRWGDLAEKVAAERGCGATRVVETLNVSGRSHFEVICRELISIDQKVYVWCATNDEYEVECGIFERLTEAGIVLSDSFPFERALRYAGLKYHCSVRDAEAVRLEWNQKLQRQGVMKFRCLEDGKDGAHRLAWCQFGEGAKHVCRFLRD